MGSILLKQRRGADGARGFQSIVSSRCDGVVVKRHSACSLVIREVSVGERIDEHRVSPSMKVAEFGAASSTFGLDFSNVAVARFLRYGV